MKYISILALFLVLLSSCSKEDQEEIDDQIIRDYLAKNQLQASEHASGLYFMITKEGHGNHPDINSTVKVKYKGYLTDGSVFDHTSGNETIEFPLKNLILHNPTPFLLVDLHDNQSRNLYRVPFLL